MRITKETIYRQAISWLLAAALAIGLLPANAFAAEPLSTKKSTVINLQLASMPMGDPMMNQTVRYEMPATQADSVNLVFLVDTSTGAQDILGQFQNMMYTSGINYIYGTMDFGGESDFVTRVISFGDSVNDSGNLTSRETLESAINGLSSGGTAANEAVGLESAINAVKDIQGNHQYAYNPTVVFCVLGDNFGNSNTTAVEEKLSELSTRFPSTAAGALITWQTQNGTWQNDGFYATSSDLLKRYATQYTKNYSSHTAAYGRADSDTMAVCLERIVHDHIQNSSIYLPTNGIDNIMGIYGGSNNYAASIDIYGQYIMPDIQLSLNRVCLQTPCFIDLQQVQCPNITSPTVVIPQTQATAEMYTGLFDEMQGTAQLNFPAVTYYGPQNGFQPGDSNMVTLSYNAGRGTGSVPSPAQMIKGDPFIVENAGMLSCANSAFGGWRGPGMNMWDPDQIYAPNEYILLQQDATLTAVFGAPVVQLEVGDTQTSSSGSSGGLVMANEQSDTGTSFEYIIRVQYTGDDGARSGSVNLSMNLPQGVTVDGTRISVSGPQQMSDWNGGFFMPEGTITQHPTVSGSTLTADFTRMTAGTEFEIHVPCTISDDGVVNGSLECWDASAIVNSTGAYMNEYLMEATPTLRLWKNSDQGTVSTPEYTLTYVLMGDVPDGVSVPADGKHKENDPVALASFSEVSGYTFDGWYRSDTHAQVSSPFTMPASPVLLYGIWTNNSPSTITVKYEYSRPDPDNNDIPAGAPDLEGEEYSVPVNGSYYIVWIGSDVSHHTFGGWTPKLNINNTDIPLTDNDNDGIYTDTNGKYRIPVSGSLDASQFADETGAVVLTYSGPWEPYTGTIQFDGNGGQGSMAPLTGVAWCTKTQHLTENQFTYPVPGYTFDGWSTTINGPKVKDDQALADKLIETNGAIITLYARWVRSSYQVEYQLDGVSSSETASSVLPNGEYTTTLSTTDSNFTFREVRVTMGGRDVTADVYNSDTHTITIPSVSGDIIIYAKAAAPVPEITVAPQWMNFGTVNVGYTLPAAQTVTVTNTGTEPLTVNLPTSVNYTITAGTGFLGTTASLAVGSTASFTVQPKGNLPANVYNETLTVSTSTPGVEKTVTAHFTVSQGVQPTPTKHTITVSVTGGTASPSGVVQVEDGQDQTITFTSNSGYELQSVIVDGSATSLTGNSYTFYDVTADHSITVVYIKGSNGGNSGNSGGGGGGITKYPIEVVETGNGTANSNKDTAAKGEDITIDTDGKIIDITVTDSNGNEIPIIDNGDGSYAFEMPASEVTVIVEFEPMTETPNVADPDSTGVSSLLNTKEHMAYMMGYNTGLFGLVNNITRAEVAQAFYRLLLDQNSAQPREFPDVSSDVWYHEAVVTLAGMGIITGYADGTFRPEQPITRAEFTTIATRFAKASTDKEIAFSDVPTGVWYYSAVQTAVSYGWINGYEDGTFRPEQPINRAETVAIINRMLARIPDYQAIDNNMGTRFPDVPTTHWAFYDVVEASTEHEYTRPSNTSQENWG